MENPNTGEWLSNSIGGENKAKQNSRAWELPVLRIGQPMMIRDSRNHGREWKTAEVVSLSTERSYSIKLDAEFRQTNHWISLPPTFCTNEVYTPILTNTSHLRLVRMISARASNEEGNHRGCSNTALKIRKGMKHAGLLHPKLQPAIFCHNTLKMNCTALGTSRGK